jgi:hypothetical protein
MYSLKWAVDYRALKTGIKSGLIPARARDVCANCGAELRDFSEDVFRRDVVAMRGAPGDKKFYYCAVCADLPSRKQQFVATMRSLAKAQKLSVMGELMEPPKLLKLAELSGFRDHASLVDVAKSGGTYGKCLQDTLISGKMALLIYDINPQTGGPGTNGGTKAHWCTIFGYYADKGVPAAANKVHLLAVHGWANFYDWDMTGLLSSVEQMKVHPGWDLRVPVAKTPKLNFSSGAAPAGKLSFKRDGVTTIPPVTAEAKQVGVPGTDYANWNKQFIAFG